MLTSVYRTAARTLCCLLLLLTAHVLAQSNFGFVNNITAVPVPGVGHDYLHDLNEIVNPANGSLSVRIEAPRPKERGLNYPFYSFMYDSTQQFAVQYQEVLGGTYNCGPDSANDPSNGTPPQPLNCILAVSFPYRSISYPAGTNGVLSGPNSMLSSTATYSEMYNLNSYRDLQRRSTERFLRRSIWRYPRPGCVQPSHPRPTQQYRRLWLFRNSRQSRRWG